MTDTLTLPEIRVVDADTHVTEPRDLWTSRVKSKWADDVPRVDAHPTSGQEHWRIGDRWLNPEGRSVAEDGPARLKMMDEYGIYAEVLYPNIIGFEAPLIMRLGAEISIACTEAYNDFITEFASADPTRLIPIGMVPFWDLEASVKEMKRCADLGHTGILFANKYEMIGMPAFYDEYWDPIFAAAQDLDLSINFHAGFASTMDGVSAAAAGMMTNFDARHAARVTAQGIMSNHEAIAAIVTTGLCERFPRLKFISVESGFGYIPYLLESLDWHWKLYGAHHQYPMLPSEYFRRQCYGCFWFERSTLPLLATYPDNFMFETDYPHPTSLALSPISGANVLPTDHIRTAFANVPADIARKVLHDNAAHVYKLDA
jgi:predicted TIM-barrel fold metal-dependent hydrolase